MSKLTRFRTISAVVNSTGVRNISKKTILKLSVALGFTLNILVFYPGFMSPDSLAQYQQASVNVYSDWHPPIMAWVWRILSFVFVPPSGLLFFQMILLWGSIYLLALEFISTRFKVWILVLLPFFPSILTISGVLWKDVQMAFALLTIFALNYVKRQKLIFVFTLLLVFYAVSLRMNAFFALPPLVILFVIVFVRIKSKVIIALLGLTCTAAIFIGSYFLVQALTNPAKSDLASVSTQDDLSYFSLIKGESLIPGVPLTDIKKCATATPGGSQMYVIDFCLAPLANREVNSPTVYTSDLRGVWLKNIFENPLGYIKFHLYGFNIQLRAPGVTPRYFWEDGIVKNEFGFETLNGPLTKVVRNSINYLGRNADIFFKPFFWGWLNIVFCLFLIGMKSTRQRNYLLLFNLSGLTYLGSYFFLHGSDYRYSYWTTVITIFVAVLAIFQYGRNLFIIPPRRREIILISIFFITVLAFGWTSFFNIDFVALTQ
jgi:hypothetical protein